MLNKTIAYKNPPVNLGQRTECDKARYEAGGISNAGS